MGPTFHHLLDYIQIKKNVNISCMTMADLIHFNFRALSPITFPSFNQYFMPKWVCSLGYNIFVFRVCSPISFQGGGGVAVADVVKVLALVV